MNEVFVICRYKNKKLNPIIVLLIIIYFKQKKIKMARKTMKIKIVDSTCSDLQANN